MFFNEEFIRTSWFLIDGVLLEKMIGFALKHLMARESNRLIDPLHCFATNEATVMVHCLFSRQVAPNKMQGHFWHLFLIQFFMLFMLVVSVLLSMVAFSTPFLLVNTFQQPIRTFEISGYWSNHGGQNAGYHVKEHRKLNQKQVSKVTLHFVWRHISRKQTVICSFQ